MLKWFSYVFLLILLTGSYIYYKHAISEQERIRNDIATLEKVEEHTDTIDQMIAKLKNDAENKSAERTFTGILLTFFTSGFVGLLFVTLVLPMVAHRFAHLVYDSGEMLERDPMHDGRSLVAQGEYEKAIVSFKAAAASDPLNRLPWVEIARLQRNQLHDPEAAIHTLRTALEGQEWQVNDAAYLLFRLAELYDEDRNDRTTAVAIMHQVIDEFPETRHSANARHKLRDWGLV